MAFEINRKPLGLEKTWRWFGDSDPVPLQHIKMAGATGVVTALHHIPNGEIWTIEEINKRKREIEAAGLKWSVVESLPVHEDIKRRTGKFEEYIDNYQQSILNIAKCGIDTVCYNFMPVLDWTRTDLSYELPNGAKALRFDLTQLAVFDLFMLMRPGADAEYSLKQKEDAEKMYKKMTKREKDILADNILAGLPGAEEGYSLLHFQSVLDSYKLIGKDDLRNNLFLFLNQIIPSAVDAGVYMAIHPDDPPFSILGLPRVVSTEEDIRQILEVMNTPNNGWCFCSGSLGVRADNQLPEMVAHFGHRINFIHLRSTIKDELGNFYEAGHLEGDVDMFEVLKALLNEQQKRIQSGRSDYRMPMRPDHGHQMLDDINKSVNPGYAAIGRLKGLAELRGLELGIKLSI